MIDPYLVLGAAIGLAIALSLSLLVYPLAIAISGLHRLSHRRHLTPAQMNSNPLLDWSLPPSCECRDVEFRSLDDLALRGYLVTRPNVRRAIVLGHGHGESLDHDAALLAAPLCQAGFNVLCFDLRGHGRSDGQRVSMGVYEPLDMLGGVSYLVNQGYGPIGILGRSLGATVAIAAVGLTEEEITTLVGHRCPEAQVAARAIGAIVAESPLVRMLPTVEGVARRAGVPRWAIRLGSPMFNLLYRLWIGAWPGQVDTVGRVKRVSPRPLFIVHGEEDAEIDMTQIEDLYTAADPPKEFWRVAGAGHGQVAELYLEEYLDRVIAFFDRVQVEEGYPDAR